MQITASELAAILNGKLEGDPNVAVNRPSKIEEGGEGSISFLGNLKYEQHLYSTTASVVIIPNSLTLKTAISATIIRVEDVYQSLGILLKKFENQGKGDQGVHALAFVHEGADIHPEASIAPFAYIGKNVQVGKGCQIGAHVFIGDEVKIGEGSIVYPGAVIYQSCEIGQSCIIHSNAVIGSDGFGFSPREDGGYDKIPQVGNVVLENDVEIGANTVIDRASIGHTVIKQGVKLDNLIQIAHNVEIGQDTVIAAQAGIAGSTKLGKGCRIGGQAGFVGHIEVADGSMVQAQSGVAQALTTPKGAYYGSPAIGYRDYLKSYALFKRLPDLQKQIKALEAKVKALEADKK